MNNVLFALARKCILLSICLIWFSTAFSQGKDPLHLFDSTRTDTANFTTVYNDVKGSLSGMAASLKTTADHVYSVLVVQQKIKAVMWICILLAVLPLVFVGYKTFPQTWGSNSMKSTICALSIMLSGIIFLTVVFNVGDILTGIFNPEYGALKEIMNFVKPE